MEINREMLVQSFREETEECLVQMEQLLLALETRPDDREMLSSLFRAVHTIKGNASLLEFNALAGFLHTVEDLLDLSRSHAAHLTHEGINVLLQSVDAVREMAGRAVQGDENIPAGHLQLSTRLTEIAAEFMTTFYHVQIGALETQELRTSPTPFWLVCFSDTIKGPLRQLFFVVVMPDGTIIEPRVAKRL